MGVVLGVLLLAVLFAGLTAWPLLQFRATVRTLGIARARIEAYLLLGLPVAIMTAIAVWWVAAMPFDGRFVLLATLATVAALSLLPRRVVELTGGPRDESSAVEAQLHARLASASEHLQGGNRPAWRAELEAAAATWEAEGASIREAVRRILEADRREAPRDLRAGLKALELAKAARWPAPKAVRRTVDVVAATILIGTFSWASASGVVARHACIGSEVPSGKPSTVEMSSSGPIADSLLVEPEPGAEVVLDLPLNLAQAAETRADPNARADLEEAGFVAGHYRAWTASDGRNIHADAFEFRDQAGALEYQQAVHRYACRAANLHFDAPGGGIGLQTRYDSGDPIVEQISWVSDTRRYVVSVRHLAPPADHSRILAIYQRAVSR
jgi:hypothetical protein